MPKDKLGNELTWKEFMSRWKQGIEGITPYQQIKSEMLGTRIILIGLICGLIVSIVKWKSMWWIAIVLLGALFNTGITFVAQKQKCKFLKKMEFIEKEVV